MPKKLPVVSGVEPSERKPPKDKILKELKAQTKLLKEMKEILDNTWRERLPQ